MQAGGATVERVGRAFEQACAGGLLDERADGIRSDPELEGGVMDADAWLAIEEPQELAFGMGHLEGFANGAGAVAEPAADA